MRRCARDRGLPGQGARDRPGLEELLTWLLDPAPTPQGLVAARRAGSDLEPIRHLSDAHARNVATAFAEASDALYAAADVNAPDAGSVFDDHN